MHSSSYKLMEQFVSKYLDPNKELIVADIGSLNINGCYRPLLENPKWKYIGIDLISGSNVDIVVPYPYNYFNIEDDTYDVIISGQTLEHVGRPFLWMKELNRILKPGGIICIICPWSFTIHEGTNYRDYWRVLPSGMGLLLKDSGFEVLEVFHRSVDTVGIAQKMG